ncbi:MFS transporter [Marinomonas balearica]|uniref:YNFM family putative membrane transporter n=1 Tax=Marinomonas balearica TaxID=491947 RepID=A0A4V3CGZ2_9GAMM|nr:MFS transporter [Marinomonas balearica]TDO99592.1 YNFM family putative membrane transporter [Marinomonas balearica]
MIHSNSPAFWRGTLALVIGSFMVFANVYVTQPLLPMIAQEFSISPLQASGSFTITTFTLGMSLLIYGPISDALGRRGIMLLTLIGTTLTTWCLSLVTQYEMLLVLRGIQGFFLAGLPAIAVAYLGDEYSPDALLIAVGLYISGNTLGGIGGRLIGGFVGESFGPFAAFAAMGIVSSLCLLGFYLLLPPSAHFQPKPLNLKSIQKTLLTHLTKRQLIISYLVGGLSFFIFINQYSYVTFVLEGAPYNLSAKYVGLLFLTYLSGTLGSAVSGKLAKRFNQPNIMIIGTSVFMCGSLITLGDALLAIIIGLLVNSFGFFLCHSTCSAFVSRNAGHSKASASSLYLVFYYVGASTGGFYLDPFWHYGGWETVIFGSLIILGSVLFLETRLLNHNGNSLLRGTAREL